MDDTPDIASIAALLADPARATIAWTLIDGTRRPAGELAFAANISAQSASAHLAKLVDGGLLAADAQGRHRYFRIASREARAPDRRHGLVQHGGPSKAAASARTGAGHAAAVPASAHVLRPPGRRDRRAAAANPCSIRDGWPVQGRITELTPTGRQQLAALGVSVEAGAGKPPPVRPLLRGPDAAPAAPVRRVGRSPAGDVCARRMAAARAAFARGEHYGPTATPHSPGCWRLHLPGTDRRSYG